MIDPVGLAGAGGMQPIAPISAPGGVKHTAAGESFKDLLMKNLEQVNELQRGANEAIEDLHTGKRDDLETVLMATAQADTAFRMLLSVRNKMMAAYNELQSIRV